MKVGHWFGLILCLIALYIAWQLRQLWVIVVGAVMLANALSGVVRRLEQGSRLQRPAALAITLGLSLFLIISFFGLLVPPLVTQINQLPDQVIQGMDRLGPGLAQIERRFQPEFWALLPDWEAIISEIPELANNLLGEGWNLFSNTLGAMLNLVLLTVLTLMLLVSPQAYRSVLIRLFPAFYRRRVDEILLECDRALQEWFSRVAFNVVVVMGLSFTTLILLRIPLALSQALMAGFFTLIPTLGLGLSVIPPMAIALLDQPWKSLMILIVYIAIHQWAGHWLTPRLLPYGEQATTPLPAITLLTQLFFAIAFGIPGLFLSLPLTIVGRIWFTEVVLRDILNHWRSPRPRIPPHIRI
ncbi:MAG: AI-2E family transporter [Spirulina sp. DLM2.Bin59]|nr:MAG: AI-2E family transporter [Spirulina sp. DLM2.Bin59]